jgi:hypothetical protein
MEGMNGVERQHPRPELAGGLSLAAAWAIVLLSLVACSRPATPTAFVGAPTANVEAPIDTVGASPPVIAAATGAAEALSGAPPAATVTAGPLPTRSPLLTRLDQYRAWMEQARATHPYTETIEIMWAVMLCESEGNAQAVGFGRYYGLFQYTPETWSGEWNPYRAYSIYDARAQIFATAKAWSEGYQLWWWGCLPER